MGRPTIGYRRFPRIVQLAFGGLVGAALGILLVSAPSVQSANAQPKRSADGFYEYQEAPEARERSSSSAAPKKLAGDYGRYKNDFAELCRLVEEDGRRILIYQTLLSMNVADRLCIDCRPFARAFAAPCRPAELRGGQKRRAVSSAASSQEAIEETEVVIPTATPTPTPSRLPSLAVNQKLLELGRTFAADEKRNRESLKALDKLALLLSSEEGRTPGEREYGETFAAFLLSPFSDLREQFAAEERAARRQAAEDASIDAALGGGFGSSAPRSTEGLFER